MFEVGIISIIVLAVGYWVTLWLMGRHDDVLHGHFVHAEDAADAPARSDPGFPARPPFPPKPVIKRRAVPAAIRPAMKSKAIKPDYITPDAIEPAASRSAPSEIAPAPAGPASPATSSERSDTLQSLLASIKRDLKDASQL